MIRIEELTIEKTHQLLKDNFLSPEELMKMFDRQIIEKEPIIKSFAYL